MPSKLVSQDAITAKWLEDEKACADQIERFRAVFGERAELTRANLDLAVEHGFDLNWLVCHLLESPALWTYVEMRARAWEEYMEALMPVWRAYREVTAPSRRAYEAMALTRREYDAATAAACRAYREVKEAAWRAYQVAMADVLADILALDDHETHKP